MSRIENIKNYYKKKTFEKHEAERKKKFKEVAIDLHENKKKEYYNVKAFNNNEEERKESLCVYNIYNNMWERAFHNCFSREENFKGYIKKFKKTIKQSFVEGMSWDNYGEWEIDHKIPLAAGGEHNVNNLQALWKTDNRSKGCKIL